MAMILARNSLFAALHEFKVPRAAVIAVIAVEAVVLEILGWNQYFRFDEYAGYDQGSWLAVQYLVGKGLRPEVDFGYNYGLLPVFLGKLFWRHDTSFEFALTASIIALLMALAIIRVLLALDRRVLSVLMAALTLPLLLVRFDNIAYVVEAALLANALAEQLNGRLRIALALSLTAILAKPAIAYGYSLLLIIVIFQRSEAVRQCLASIGKAAAMPLVLGVILIMTFGPLSVVSTIIPFQGVLHYHAMHWIPFSTSRLVAFLLSDGANWHYYARDYFLFWIGSVLVLVSSAWSVRRHQDRTPIAQVACFCALLLLVDLTLFTFRVPFFLVIGIVICASLLSTANRLAAVVLCALAFPPFISWVRADIGFTRAFSRSSRSCDLWIQPWLLEEYSQTMAVVGTRDAVCLGEMGALGLVTSRCEKPVGAFFLPGSALAADLEREAVQLRDAKVVVLFKLINSTGTPLDSYPVLKQYISGARTTYKGDHIVVLDKER